jgi:hypothetical protein
MIKSIHDFNKQQQYQPEPQILRVVCCAVPTNVTNAVSTTLMIKIIQDF